ncbi:bifunctional 2-polyprenyl-6-hydroxyphenol methylase/3-demethylubiquinol 3-O-methyltransferase UbiG [Spirochaetota bacterium]
MEIFEYPRIGCGGGYACEEMAKMGASVSGIDQSQKSIEAAKNHALENNLKINYEHCNAENLPYKKNSFHVVMCVDVLEHLTDLDVVISEINRVLKPGGIFLFDTINRTFMSRLLMIWVAEYILKIAPMGLQDWNMFIKPEELRTILEKSGFNNIDFKGFHLRGKDKKTGSFGLNLIILCTPFILGIAKRDK